MTRDGRSPWASWIMACVLPLPDLEVVMGDLAEEYPLPSRSTSDSRVSRWYWGQVSRSIPPLLWASIRRGGWLATLAAALGACMVQATVELAFQSAMSGLLTPDVPVPAIFTLIAGLTTLVLVGYLAAWLRPGAATVLATTVVIAVVVQMATKGTSMPL